MIDDFDSDKDQPSVRVFSTGNNKVFLRRSDPFGFWSISLERGALPEKYKGDYTTPTEAEAAVQVYLSERGKEGKPIPA